MLLKKGDEMEYDKLSWTKLPWTDDTVEDICVWIVLLFVLVIGVVGVMDLFGIRQAPHVEQSRIMFMNNCMKTGRTPEHCKFLHSLNSKRGPA